MAFFLTDSVFNAVFKTAWTGAKNTGRAVRGKHIKRDKETGLEYSVSPMRDGLMGDLKRHGKSVITGRRYDKHGDVIEKGGPIRNRLAGLGGIGADLTVGLVGQGIGWTARNTTKAAIGTGVWLAPKVARQTGRMTKEAFDLVGDTAINAAEAVVELSKTKRGQAGLFTASALSVGAFPFAAELLSTPGGKALKEGLAMSVGSPMEGLSGTSTDVMNNSRHYVDSMNADGELVFAMHNLR